MSSPTPSRSGYLTFGICLHERCDCVVFESEAEYAADKKAIQALADEISRLSKKLDCHKELVSLAKRVCFPNGGRDYTDAKEELAALVLKLEGKK